MNKLEQRIAGSFKNEGGSAKEMRTVNAKIMAELVLEVAKEAYEFGWVRMRIAGYNGTTDPQKTFDDGFEAFKQNFL